MKKSVLKVGFVICCLVFVGAAAIRQDSTPSVAQIVALDECDPTTFNAAIGPDFCKNVSLAVLGYATTIQDLIAKAGQAPVPECAAGFSDVSVAKTRLLQGSTSQITGLSRGIHHFQCCLHPWMRVTVDVK